MMAAQEKRDQRIPGYITATEQELIAMAAALERRDARSWVRLVLLPVPMRAPPPPFLTSEAER